MKMLLVLTLLISATTSSASIICTAMCASSWSSLGYSQSATKFISVIASGTNEAEATEGLKQKCASFEKSAKAVLGLQFSESKDRDYISITSVKGSSFSCVEL
jgi:hypothetical protein